MESPFSGEAWMAMELLTGALGYRPARTIKSGVAQSPFLLVRQVSEIEIREAVKKCGPTGQLVLQEVYSFGSRASAALQDQGVFEDPDPWIIVYECLVECDEAFVAEHEGEIVGAATLSFSGIRGNRAPTLEGVYVMPPHRGHGIGQQLVVQAMTRFVELGKTPVHCIVSTAAMGKTIEGLARTHSDLAEHLIAHRQD